MVTGCVRVDLSYEPDVCETTDRRTLTVLEQCPDGVRVIVDLGDRRHITYDAVHYLHEHGSRLTIEVTGSNPETVALFVRAARAGDLAVIS